MIQKSKLHTDLKYKVSYKITHLLYIKNEDLKVRFKNYKDEQINPCCQVQEHEIDPRDHVVEEKN